MRIAIVLNESLGVGYLANASACIASGLYANESQALGHEIQAIGFTYAAITKIPCLILKQNRKPWKELLARALKNKLKYVVFTNEAQSTTSYEEYETRVKGKAIDDVEVIGFGVIDEDQSVTKFSGDLALLR